MAKAPFDLYAPLPLPADGGKKMAEDYARLIENALGDRRDLENRWERAYRLYEGIRPERTRPWKGAANVNVPIVASHASAIHARFMITIFGSDPIYRVRARNPEFQNFARAATDYLEWARQNQFDLYPVVRDFAWDAIKYGLGVIKASWRRRVGPLLRHERTSDGTFRIVMDDQAVLEDRPFIEAIPPHRFIWPNGYDSVQACPWVAIQMKMTEDDMRQAYAEKYFDRLDNALGAVGVRTDHLDQVKAEVEGLTAPTHETADIYEIWARRPIPGKGVQIVQLIIEPTTATVLRFRLNPHFHRRYPIIIGRLEAREHTLPGLGVADQIGDINEESNTIHNQTIDATTVSICQMFGARAGTPAWDALAEIWPGKRIPMAGPDDIKEIGLGPLKVNSLPMEQQLLSYAERRTGISDFGLGREPTPGRRGTATGTLAIIQEGNKKFDYQIRDMREALGELGMMFLSMIQQNNPTGVNAEVLGADGESLTQLSVTFPEEPVDRIAAVEVVAGSPSLNRQSQRQDAISLFQIIFGSVYPQAIQLAQLMQSNPSPAMQALFQQVARGAGVLLEEVLSAFENRRAGEIIPDLQEIYNEIGAEGLAQAAAVNAGMAGPSGPVQGAGVGSQGQLPGGQSLPAGAGIRSPGPNVAGPRGGVGGGTAPA